MMPGGAESGFDPSQLRADIVNGGGGSESGARPEQAEQKSRTDRLLDELKGMRDDQSSFDQDAKDRANMAQMEGLTDDQRVQFKQQEAAAAKSRDEKEQEISRFLADNPKIAQYESAQHRVDDLEDQIAEARKREHEDPHTTDHIQALREQQRQARIEAQRIKQEIDAEDKPAPTSDDQTADAGTRTESGRPVTEQDLRAQMDRFDNDKNQQPSAEQARLQGELDQVNADLENAIYNERGNPTDPAIIAERERLQAEKARLEGELHRGETPKKTEENPADREAREKAEAVRSEVSQALQEQRNQITETAERRGFSRLLTAWRRSSSMRSITGVIGATAAGMLGQVPGLASVGMVTRLFTGAVFGASRGDEQALRAQEQAALGPFASCRNQETGEFDRAKVAEVARNMRENGQTAQLIEAYAKLTEIASLKGLEINQELRDKEVAELRSREKSRNGKWFSRNFDNLQRMWQNSSGKGKILASVAIAGLGIAGSFAAATGALPAAAVMGVSAAINVGFAAIRADKNNYKQAYEHTLVVEELAAAISESGQSREQVMQQVSETNTASQKERGKRIGKGALLGASIAAGAMLLRGWWHHNRAEHAQAAETGARGAADPRQTPDGRPVVPGVNPATEPNGAAAVKPAGPEVMPAVGDQKLPMAPHDSNDAYRWAKHIVDRMNDTGDRIKNADYTRAIDEEKRRLIDAGFFGRDGQMAVGAAEKLQELDPNSEIGKVAEAIIAHETMSKAAEHASESAGSEHHSSQIHGRGLHRGEPGGHVRGKDADLPQGTAGHRSENQGLGRRILATITGERAEAQHQKNLEELYHNAGGNKLESVDPKKYPFLSDFFKDSNTLAGGQSKVDYHNLAGVRLTLGHDGRVQAIVAVADAKTPHGFRYNTVDVDGEYHQWLSHHPHGLGPIAPTETVSNVDQTAQADPSPDTTPIWGNHEVAQNQYNDALAAVRQASDNVEATQNHFGEVSALLRQVEDLDHHRSNTEEINKFLESHQEFKKYFETYDPYHPQERPGGGLTSIRMELEERLRTAASAHREAIQVLDQRTVAEQDAFERLRAAEKALNGPNAEPHVEPRTKLGSDTSTGMSPEERWRLGDEPFPGKTSQGDGSTEVLTAEKVQGTGAGGAVTGEYHRPTYQEAAPTGNDSVVDPPVAATGTSTSTEELTAVPVDPDSGAGPAEPTGPQ